MRIAVLLGVLFLTLPAETQAPAPGTGKLANLDEARALTEKVMAQVRQEKFAEAYALAKPYWPLPAIEIDALANQMSTQWPMISQRFGASLGTEFIRESKAGQSFAQYVYVQKFERHATRWVFMFYKPKDHWLVNAVSWDDSVDRLFE